MKRKKRFNFKNGYSMSVCDYDYDNLFSFFSCAETYSVLSRDAEIYAAYQRLMQLLSNKLCPCPYDFDLVSSKVVSVFKRH